MIWEAPDFDETQRIVDARELPEDARAEQSLRPKSLDDYLGQSRIKDNLAVLIEAARMRREPLDHLLFSGPPGLGKTTLASVVANEMGVQIRTTSGPAIDRAGDLAAILTNLEEGDILFIDEIHRLNRAVEEVLYPAMEDYAIDIVIGQGPAARSIRLDIPHFTLIAATTRSGMLTGPLRDRFGAAFHMDYYSDDELKDIVIRSATILSIDIDDGGAFEIASRSRATPRLANRLLKRERPGRGSRFHRGRLRAVPAQARARQSHAQGASSHPQGLRAFGKAVSREVGYRTSNSVSVPKSPRTRS